MENMLILAAWDLAFFKAVFLCALALGLIIFIHELGHFLVAKACGVRCDKFYIGFDFFGLKLLHFKYGETEYGIGVFPLGGYVKMLGQEDNPGETRERIAKAKEAQEKLAKYREALQNGQQPAEMPGELLEDGTRESLTEE
ncbi:MAG: site-2 protease family protein, partial [Thermoguttaceae bacterium]|nr:site-2 protease family protein [Thermoguttaceae bacterium]